MATNRLVKLNYYNGEENFIKFVTWPEGCTFSNFKKINEYYFVRQNFGSFAADWCLIDDAGNACEIGGCTDFEDMKTLFPNTPIEFYINPFSYSTQFCWQCNEPLHQNFYKKEKTKEYLCVPCFKSFQVYSDNLVWIPNCKKSLKKFQIKKSTESKEDEKKAAVAANEIENTELINNASQSLLAMSESLKIAIANAVDSFSKIINEPFLNVDPTQMIIQNINWESITNQIVDATKEKLLETCKTTMSNNILSEEGLKEVNDRFVSILGKMDKTQEGFQEALLEFQEAQNLAIQKIAEASNNLVQVSEKTSQNSEKIDKTILNLEALSITLEEKSEEEKNTEYYERLESQKSEESFEMVPSILRCKDLKTFLLNGMTRSRNDKNRDFDSEED